MKTRKKLNEAQVLITDLRSHGITREELAFKTGLSYATISRWERGVSEPRPFELEYLKSLRSKHASHHKCTKSSECA